ncbi:AAA family ATPase [Aeromonas dhakensis]|uniref:AAA family ATPase n=1 Tax=Aeromonas dhakensis TaxID=196024 RepID=UPI002B4A18CA|nr:AAA family ATPase [Aeromonas dhakensis]
MGVFKVKRIELQNVKSFDGKVSCELNDSATVISFSGRNGSGKSTLLKAAYLVQKGFFSVGLGENHKRMFNQDAERFLNADGSFIKVTIDVAGEDVSVEVIKKGDEILVECSNQDVLTTHWNIFEPKNIFLYVDASKGFSEETLLFDEIDISKNSKLELTLLAIFNPERLFSGIYQQLVKDYVNDRLIPSKPDRLLYFKVASKMFTSLIPNVEIKNFSGNHKPGEFVLLGKANTDKRKPLYDVREFSSGEKALLSTLSFLCISNSVSSIFIDEPENHFHEGLLLEFIALLYKLCDENGILSWFDSQLDSSIKREWLEKDYKNYKINQVVLSTHSKTLIYKIFSMGVNYTVSDGVNELIYESAEDNLRGLGLSSIHRKVIFVEGKDDHEALEYIFKGENLIIKPLGGSQHVIEMFSKLADINSHIYDMKFVFLVDSDNKPEDFFNNIRSKNTKFYDASFIKMNCHELENYFLDPRLFLEKINEYLSVSDVNRPDITLESIDNKIVEIVRGTQHATYKKEISLHLQHVVERYFSERIWGSGSFDFSSKETASEEISSSVISESGMLTLKAQLHEAISTSFGQYSGISNSELIRRCDGKKVFNIASSYFAKDIGIEHKTFKKALIKKALSSNIGDLASLIDEIKEKLK